MTPEEEAWTREVYRRAMEIVAVCGLLDMEALEGSKEKRRARKASVKALALVDACADRLTKAGVGAEAAAVAAGDYDLAALATAPPATIED